MHNIVKCLGGMLVIGTAMPAAAGTFASLGIYQPAPASNSCFVGSIGGLGVCGVALPAVNLGYVLAVEHVSCEFKAPSTATFLSASLFAGTFSVLLAAVKGPVFGSQTSYIVSQELSAYLPQSSTPALGFSVAGAPGATISAKCTLTGRLL